MNMIRKSILEASHEDLLHLSKLYAVPISSFYRSLANNRELNAQKLTKEILEKVILSPEVNFSKMDFMGYEKYLIEFRARCFQFSRKYQEY